MESNEVLHHVTGRAPKGLMLFRDEIDYVDYLELLGEEVVRRKWSLRTYCLMGNHLHLLIGTPDCDLGQGMKRIHERFARRLHHRHEGHGHVFGGRFHNRLVKTSAHEVACLRYIALNPVKAGLCEEAGDWRWSAHRFLAGDAIAPPFLDVDNALAEVTRTGYGQLVLTDDGALLDALTVAHPATWMAHAVDDHGIAIVTLAGYAGLRRAMVYRRLAVARERRLGAGAARRVALTLARG